MFIRRDYDGILSCRMRRKSSRWMNEAYRDYFPIGAALAQYSLDRFGSDLLEHYGSFTPESEMKWNIVHPADGAHKFKLTFENLNNSVSDAAILLRGGGQSSWNASGGYWDYYEAQTVYWTNEQTDGTQSSGRIEGQSLAGGLCA